MDLSAIPSPPSDTAISWARSHAGVTIALNIIAFFVLVGRIYTRAYPTLRLNADDWVIIVAWFLILFESVFLLLTVPFVFGRDPSTITLQDVQNSSRYAVIAQPLWSWGMAAIKNSIALMLLRFETNIGLRRFLWANIVIQVLLAMYNMLSQLLICDPLHKVWDLTGTVPGTCWSSEAIRDNLICQSSVFIVTDIILALMPISFLRKVKRPMRERVIVGVLMGLGILASAASMAKVQAAIRIRQVGDATAVGIQVGMWSAVEELTAFICACVPCLRSPFQRLLKHFGVISSDKSSSAQGYYNMGAGNFASAKGSEQRMANDHMVNKSIKMKSMRSTTADADSDTMILSEEATGDGDGIWRTTEVVVEGRIKPPGFVDDPHRDVLSSWDDKSPTSESSSRRKVIA